MSTLRVTDDIMDDIMTKALRNNERDGITGVLVYFERTREFAQILEGPKYKVQSLLATLQADPRHQRIHVFYEGSIQKRQFPEWSMAFATESQEGIETLSDIKGLSAYTSNDNGTSTTLRLLRTLFDMVYVSRRSA